MSFEERKKSETWKIEMMRQYSSHKYQQKLCGWYEMKSKQKTFLKVDKKKVWMRSFFINFVQCSQKKTN